ncbi:hypothetical protein D1007_33410 [Hordeum vulgare]|nr:hypothetical protein D1007_33410 [Hordeum vulgare]
MNGGHPDPAGLVALGERVSPAVPLHFHALLSSVLPPFSGFLDAVLSHYQIHALHMDPCSLILLSAFMFLFEAFVGVTPSMELLVHFFFLELAFEMQCSGCVSLKTDDASSLGIPCVELLPEAEGFRQQWVQVQSKPRVRRANPRKLMTHQPSGSDASSSVPTSYVPGDAKTGVESEELAPVLTRLGQLTSGNPDELPSDGQSLYRLKAPKALTAEMSLVDEWGLVPQGGNIPMGPCLLGFGPAKTLIAWLPPGSWWGTNRRPPSSGSASGRG